MRSVVQPSFFNTTVANTPRIAFVVFRIMISQMNAFQRFFLLLQNVERRVAITRFLFLQMEKMRGILIVPSG